ncbi:MAG: TonB-dependent receptor [Acidobacteria bacterium]|nr:TonB-dependent receptor [Acidobacteriota bacterium]
MKNPGSGVQSTDNSTCLSTCDEGRYRAPNLALGSYEVQAQLAGFRTGVRSGITLTVGREAIVEITLGVGELTEKVVVSGEAPLVETTSASVSGLIDEKTIQDLPLNGRSLEQLIQFQPGVTLSRAAGGGGATGGTVSLNGTANVNVGGARIYQNSYLLDNTDVNDTLSYTPGSVAGNFLGVDAIREYKVLVNSYSAEYGRAAGGIVSAVTRSGTNEVHGSAFEFYRNSTMDARNFFDPKSDPPPFWRHHFGFTLGGPVRKNQTFFFGNYEGLREDLSTTQVTNVPTAAARQGVLPTRTVQVHPAIRPYLALLALPNGRDNGDGSAQFLGAGNKKTHEDYFMLRIDHNLSSAHSLFGRYTLDDTDIYDPQAMGNFASTPRSRNQYFTLEEKTIVSQALLNTLRFGLNRSVSSFHCSQLVDIPSTLDIVPGRSFGTGGQMTITGIATLGSCNLIRDYHLNVYEYSEDLNYAHGRHSMKTGALVKNLRSNQTSWASYSGEYSFSGLQNFLLGVPRLYRALFPGADPVRTWRQTLYGFYYQDDFKVKSNLNLNLGLRYEFITAPIEVFGRSARLLNDLDAQTTVLGRGAFVETSKKGFQPRIGFAWDPFKNGKTAVRGGIGTFVEPILPFVYAFVAGARQPPFYRRASITDPPFPNAYDIMRTSDANRFAEITLNNLSPTTSPYTIRYSLDIQRQLAPSLVFNVGYVGSSGLHLYRTSDHNTAIPQIQSDGRKFFPAGSVRRNPFIGEHLNITTDSRSLYNSMVLSLNKRFTGGARFQVSYTWAKMMDDSSAFAAPETSGSARNNMDPEDKKRDYSLSSQHVGQNFLFNANYELPFGKGATGWGRLAAGWEMSGIMTLATGVPINVELDFNRARDAQSITNYFNQRPDLAPGRSSNPVLGGPEQYIDPAAFQLQPAGFYGNLGRNTVLGPGYVNTDFSLLKNTRVTEGRNLQFRAEFFNVINHANFGAPDHTLFSDATGRPRATFGRITSTISRARQIQLALKFIF